MKQESASLLKIGDSFKKIIIVKDDIMPKRDDNGIVTIGLKMQAQNQAHFITSRLFND